MLFNSIHFIVFLPLVLLGYYLIPGRAKTVWLLLASYFFYMCWNAQYLLLILVSTLVTWLCALALERIDRDAPPERRTQRKKLAAEEKSCSDKLEKLKSDVAGARYQLDMALEDQADLRSRNSSLEAEQRATNSSLQQLRLLS